MMPNEQTIQSIQARLAKQTARLVSKGEELNELRDTVWNLSKQLEAASRTRHPMRKVSVFDEDPFDHRNDRFLPFADYAEAVEAAGRVRIVMYDENAERILDICDTVPPKRHSTVYIHGYGWTVEDMYVVLNCDGVPCEVHAMLD
jgi:hypothetical protein